MGEYVVKAKNSSGATSMASKLTVVLPDVSESSENASDAENIPQETPEAAKPQSETGDTNKTEEKDGLSVPESSVDTDQPSLVGQPEFTTKPETVNVEEGDTIHLRCTVTG